MIIIKAKYSEMTIEMGKYLKQMIIIKRRKKAMLGTLFRELSHQNSRASKIYNLQLKIELPKQRHKHIQKEKSIALLRHQ